MLNLMPMHVPGRGEFTRRDALRLGTVGGLGMTLPQILSAANTSPRAIDATRHPATAKRSIYIFLCGGPSRKEEERHGKGSELERSSQQGKSPSEVGDTEDGRTTRASIDPRSARHRWPLVR